MTKRKICVVTGTRAEYGLLYWLMKEIQQDPELELQLVVTGMHLSPEFGLTYKQIEADGFYIHEKVEMLLSSDTQVGIATSLGLGTIGFASVFQRLKPDLLILLGDRFELLSVAQVALISGIPIAHLHGGELTFGAYDDSIRHAITKMSTWHFASTTDYRKRIVQLGESPERVWNVGALGIDNILKLPFLSKNELYKELNINNNNPYFLITYHPETNGQTEEIHVLLDVLDEYENINLIFTKSNADNGGRLINHQIEEFVKMKKNRYIFHSLGQIRYLSATKYALAVIGNSSSGLIEAPYLHTPTVNIGKRQEGRQKPSSVIDAEIDSLSIKNAIQFAMKFNKPFEKIFGNGNTSAKIVKIIKNIPNFSIYKEFYDL